jgi:hypothetical protein
VWIAIGIVAAVGFISIGVALNGNTTPATTKAATQATEGPTSPPWDTGTTPADTTPDVTEPPASAPAALAVGETGSFTSDEGDADITVTKVEAATRDPSPYGDRATHGWFVVVHLKATGNSGSYDVNSFDFYVKSSSGYHTEDPEYLESWGPVFEGGTLHAGEHLSGTIVYDVPTRHGKLVYTPNFDNEPLATWSY